MDSMDKNKNINLGNLKDFKKNIDIVIPKRKALTQSEYDALSNEEKNSDTIYFITNETISKHTIVDTELNKESNNPISNKAVVDAIDEIKETINNLDVHEIELTDYVKKGDVATTSKNGLMSLSDKTKLDNLQIETQWIYLDSLSSLKTKPVTVTYNTTFKNNPLIFAQIIMNGTTPPSPTILDFTSRQLNSCKIEYNPNYTVGKDPAGISLNDLNFDCYIGLLIISSKFE